MPYAPRTPRVPRMTGDSHDQAVRMLAWEAGYNSRISAETVDMARYLTTVIEKKPIDENEFEAFDDELSSLLESKLDAGASPHLLAAVLWSNLVAIEHSQNSAAMEGP